MFDSFTESCRNSGDIMEAVAIAIFKFYALIFMFIGAEVGWKLIISLTR